MSTDKIESGVQSAPLGEKVFRTDGAPKTRQPAIENIDVAALKVDQTYEVDCDPYNSTGQFLADAVKKMHDDA